MKNIAIVTITVLLFFSSVLEAKEGKVIGKVLGNVVAGFGEKADLTKEQLHNCILLQKGINEKTKKIDQANSELKTIKEEVDKHAKYIEKERLKVKNFTNKQINSLNNTILKQKKAITKYNNKVDYSKEKFTSYKTDKESFNINCSDKSYNADDMKTITAKIEKEDKAKAAKARKGKYSLTINLTPSDSKVRIMNIKPKYQPGILLRPGKYDVYITNENYHEYRKWIEIKKSDLNIDIILNKK
ncbi:MAG: hypothetical protein IMF12_09695 [Proteobacteria bacterium]|nr:hypothetical protein [Pseudomonadota bacterium]